jgi:hypothetical protein
VRSSKRKPRTSKTFIEGHGKVAYHVKYIGEENIKERREKEPKHVWATSLLY